MSNISLNFTEIKSIADNINKNINTYSEEVNKVVNNNFNGLRNLGLFTEGFEKIDNNIKNVVRANTSLTTAINNHINEDIDMENDIANYINNKGSNCILNVDHSTNNANVTSEYKNIVVKEVNKGMPIVTATELSKQIPVFESDNKKILLQSINTNRGNDTFSELLLNKDKADDLYKITKATLGDNKNKVTKNEGTEDLQNSILNSVLDVTDEILASNNNKSMIVGLPYLDKYASNLNTNLIDLLFSDNRKVDLMNGLNDLYQGIKIDEYNFKNSDYNAFKSFVDTLSEQNGLTPETMLRDSKYLDIIRRGVK